jgi:hypothetical protein
MRRGTSISIGLLAIGVALVMASSTSVGGTGSVGRAVGVVPPGSGGIPAGFPTVHRSVPLPPPNFTIPLNGTPVINWTGNVTGHLNSTTGRPWGEAYDTLNRCLYVTDDPSTPSTQGYLTWLGPTTGYAPTSQQIPLAGGPAWNPQGIAWAPSLAGPASWTAAFRGGILMIADTASNSVSFYGIPASTAAPTCQPKFLQTDIGINSITGALLLGPWDVVFDAHSRLFYVTWVASNVVQAWSGSSGGCEFFSNLSNPSGLSTDPRGRLEVANFQPNGWVTEFTTFPGDIAPWTICAGNPNAIISNPGKELDRSVWTTYATYLLGTNGTAGAKNIVAVSDSNWNIAGNLQGGCAPVGAPQTHVMAELNDGPLNCVNSVKLDAPAPPNPGAFGIAYNVRTHHVLEVLAATGHVEGVNFNAVTGAVVSAPGCPVSAGYCSVEVIWFPAPAATWYPGNTMAVTNWAVGTLYIAIGI